MKDLTVEQLRALVDTGKQATDELNKRWHELAEAVEQRILRHDKFDDKELIYAAYSKCQCGAGLAYPEHCSPHGAWYCSDILTHRALPKSDPDSKVHDSGFPFAFYSIKSENQPSAYGTTTRPK